MNNSVIFCLNKTGKKSENLDYLEWICKVLTSLYEENQENSLF